MLTVLRLMLTEEYRLHVSYSSPRVFFSMPAYVFAIAFFFAATLPLLENSIPLQDMLLFTNAGVFVYGLSVGAFGFLGKTYLERRYGRTNFLVAMPFLLPLTFRRAYASMFLRDVIFYIVLILVPGLGGVLVASVFAHYHLSSVLVAFTTVTLSFLLGSRRHIFSTFAIYLLVREHHTRGGFQVTDAHRDPLKPAGSGQHGNLKTLLFIARQTHVDLPHRLEIEGHVAREELLHRSGPADQQVG